jgi:hypothetical protein
VPLGWEAVTIPFSHPRTHNLTGGTGSEIGATDGQAAALSLREQGGPLIALSATQNGVWGNNITVSVSKGDKGPAYFDVTISYQGARFECARQTVLGGKELPAQSADLLKPGAVGILQSKAAGIKADVTRDRT